MIEIIDAVTAEVITYLIAAIAVGIAVLKSKGFYTGVKNFIDDAGDLLMEAAEFLKKLTEALEDDKITQEELIALKEEGMDLLEELQGMIPYTTGVWSVMKRG